MRKIISFLLISTFFLGGCSEYKKGKGIMQYKIVEDNDTPPIGKLAVVFLTYTEATEEGKMLSGTAKFDPLPLEVYATMPQFEGDVQDAFKYLSEGDSAVVKVSLDSIKRKNHSPQLANDSSKYMIYTLRIKKVINQNGKGDYSFLERVEKYKAEAMASRQAAEPLKIKRFIAESKLSYKRTPTGLLYSPDLRVINNKGKELRVIYTLSSLDGVLYSSKYEKIRPENTLLAGVREAITITPEGTRTQFIIPSNLAHGGTGDNSKMPPHTPLICKLEVMKR